ncbi:MAG: hypothetical protein VW546_10360 [Gammaproteobacteria bacterium]
MGSPFMVSGFIRLVSARLGAAVTVQADGDLIEGFMSQVKVRNLDLIAD